MISFSAKEDFPTFTPDTITGTIRVIDFSKTLFADNKQSYEVSFTNAEVN